MKLLLPFSFVGLGSAATASAGVYSHNNGSETPSTVSSRQLNGPESAGEQNQAGSTEERRENVSGTQQPKEQLDGASHTSSVEGTGDQQKAPNVESREEKSNEGERGSRTITSTDESGTGAKGVTDTPPNSGGESGRDPKGASGSNASDGAPHNADQVSK